MPSSGASSVQRLSDNSLPPLWANWNNFDFKIWQVEAFRHYFLKVWFNLKGVWKEFRPFWSNILTSTCMLRTLCLEKFDGQNWQENFLASFDDINGSPIRLLFVGGSKSSISPVILDSKERFIGLPLCGLVCFVLTWWSRDSFTR